MKHFGLLLVGLISGLAAATAAGEELSAPVPLKKVALFSSGVGYFLHSGTLSGAAEIPLAFDSESINDALKSLIVNDSATSSPSVSYASEATVERTLKSLKVNLWGDPSLEDLLAALKGEEVIITAPSEARGKILSVSPRETALPSGGIVHNNVLALLTTQGIQSFTLSEISSIKFLNAELEADFA
jgi:hypothetical protein